MFRWNDIKPEAIRDRLKKYRDAEINPIGATTSNHYLQAVKQFCTWVVEEKKSALYSPLTGLKPIDTGGKLLHERRGIDIEEFHVLMRYLESAPDVFKISGQHRSIVYSFEVETGLRFGATKALSVHRIVFHGGRWSIFVPKRNRIKYSADRWIPLGDELWAQIEPLVAGRPPNDWCSSCLAAVMAQRC